MKFIKCESKNINITELAAEIINMIHGKIIFNKEGELVKEDRTTTFVDTILSSYVVYCCHVKIFFINYIPNLKSMSSEISCRITELLLNIKMKTLFSDSKCGCVVEMTSIKPESMFLLYNSMEAYRFLSLEPNKKNGDVESYLIHLSTIVVDNHNLCLFNITQFVPRNLCISDFILGANVNTDTFYYHMFYGPHISIWSHFNSCASSGIRKGCISIGNNENIETIDWSLVKNQLNVCNHCNMPLYDYIYIVDEKPICPISLHSSSKLRKSDKILISKHPQTIKSVLDSMPVSQDYRDLILASRNGIKTISKNQKNHIVNAGFYMIPGTNFLLVQNMKEFLLNNNFVELNHKLLNKRIFAIYL